jgi:hypothetical protein
MLILNIVLGALILGSTGFILGGLLSVVINPGAEQAVLFAVFFTGPAGFIIGAILGAIVGKRRSKRWELLLLFLAIFSAIAVVSSPLYFDWRNTKYSSFVQHPSDLEEKDISKSHLDVRTLSDNDLERLERFSNLYGLDFNKGWREEAKLTDAGLKIISELNLHKLGALSLGRCKNITDAGMTYVAKIPTLNYLSLIANPQITDKGLANLSNSRSISYIDLRGCTGMTDGGLLHLAKMPSLKTLRLGGCTGITSRGIEVFSELSGVGVEKDDESWAKQPY